MGFRLNLGDAQGKEIAWKQRKYLDSFIVVVDFRKVRILLTGFRVGFALESSDCAFDCESKS